LKVEMNPAVYNQNWPARHRNFQNAIRGLLNIEGDWAKPCKEIRVLMNQFHHWERIKCFAMGRMVHLP
jgi:hypothetical protein